MRAVKLVGPGKVALEHGVAVPVPGPGEVLLRIAGAGLCHSDLHILHLGDQWPFFGNTLGHEAAGWVDAVGPDVEGFVEGEAVVSMVIWACGHCRACTEGRENACEIKGGRTNFPTSAGLADDGAMAEYMLVRARYLEKIGDLDPVDAAPLSDAGMTPMAAVNSTRHRLTPGSTAVVVGIGGLGQAALQIAANTTGARIIAVDPNEEKRTIARDLGASLTLAGDAETAARILEATDGYGVDVVLDFVGVQATVDLATRVVAPEGILKFVGLGGGSFTFAADLDGEALPWGVSVQRPFGGNRTDLRHAIALAQRGKLTIETTRYPLEQFQQALDDLEAGRVRGRAVLVP